jgi:hypothetical protein
MGECQAAVLPRTGGPPRPLPVADTRRDAWGVHATDLDAAVGLAKRAPSSPVGAAEVADTIEM